MFLSGVPLRVGYSTPETAPFLTHGQQLPEAKHSVEHNLSLAEIALAELGYTDLNRRVPTIKFDPTVEDRTEGARLWTLYRLDARVSGSEDNPPVIAVAPGAGSPAKVWDPECWALVIDHLARRFGAACLITGTASEKCLADRLVAALSIPAAVVVGETSVGVLATLLQRCRLVIGPDNGALHLAAAMGVPTMRLYGPADPVRFAPYGLEDAHSVVQTPRLCAACGYLDLPLLPSRMYPCMADITAEAVILAGRRLWAATDGSQVNGR